MEKVGFKFEKFKNKSQNKMSLRNAKVKFIRPEYNNFKEVLEDDKNIYIGRHGRIFINKTIFTYQGSKWANPFKVGKDGDINQVLKMYKQYIKEKIKSNECDLNELRGKNMYCWCVPKTIYKRKECEPCCHGQVLMKILSKTKI